MSDGVASFVVAGGVAAEALGGVCVGAVSAGRLVSLVCGQAELAVTAVAKAVSDHMLILSNLGGAGRQRQGLTLSDESTG